MYNFLKQLQLSDEAIKIYLDSLGKPPLTFSELYSTVSNINPEDFANILNELVEADLFIQIIPEKSEIVLHYMAIPPFTPILNYYTNIQGNLNTIQDAVCGLISNSINQLFQDSSTLDLAELQNQFNNIKNDLLEDFLIQRQDEKELLKQFEVIKKIKEVLFEINQKNSNLFKKLKEANKIQLEYLTNSLNNTKMMLLEQIKTLELKKREAGVVQVIENIFKTEVERIITEFINNSNTIITEEFEEIHEVLSKFFRESTEKDEEISLDSIINEILQAKNDFNLMFLNVLSTFEKNVNEIQKSIKLDHEKLLAQMDNLKDLILKNLNDIIRDSLNQVCGLSKPIEHVLKQFMDEKLWLYKARIDNLWHINTEPKIIEEIKNIMLASKEEIMILVPKLEKYLELETLKSLNKGLKIKIASSEPHTNSVVKSIKDIPNLEYRVLSSDNIIAIKGDDKYLDICIINKTAKDPKNPLIGFGCNFPSLIKILSGTIITLWSGAEFERGPISSKSPVQDMKMEKPISFPEKIPPELSRIQELKTEIKKAAAATPSLETQSDKFPSTPGKPTKFPNDTFPKISPEKIQPTQPDQISKEDVLTIIPKAGDSSGMVINSAFNTLISKLPMIGGQEFSKELQKVSDLILEKKGFSVTLHDVRRFINKYKDVSRQLVENDINEIKEVIASWKLRLF